ncbi:MAG: hypothetical protein ALECFALPRED_003257 [Alectoria fallacina]|uniref:Flavin-containing monooxygenase n=1 Tax=Alectoria fallacina TaxID=1903189 RepID=A0A8H3ITL6_9LECA|nr:MAG: hypothetical protein ALECFALPRED_003257 [Alectoria fallacina]
MATAAVQVPSHNRLEPGSNQLKPATYPATNDPPKADVHKIASEWAASLNEALSSQDYENIKQLFLQGSCWRDQLALSWDYHTFNGPEKIISFLRSSPHGSRIKSISIDDSSTLHSPHVSAADFDGKVNGVGSFLKIETDVGKGPGIVRLLQDQQDGGSWKAFTLFTTMHELKGHEETVRGNRPHGVAHGGKPGRKNWQERRTATENFDGDMEPTVLILGAGQGGLTSAARLHQLGVPTLIIDRNPRVGDNWRNRYHQLVLHDPVWYDHLPYVPFPSHWPIFTPKDKLAEWFESYAKLLELNVWTQTNLESASWDGSKRQWTVNLERKKADGTIEKRTLHPRHVIQATGHSGEMSFPQIKGMEDFKGDRLCHSSQFKGANSDSKGKKAIVVGCCNSGHDIAQDFYEHGYDVTVVQRSSTYVMSSKEGLDVLLAGLYEEGGPDTEDADLMFMSIPNAMLKRMHVDATKEIARRDADLLAGLQKAGFKLDNGPDDAGFFMKYFQRGGGYYIDVGASQLIIDGKIKVKQGQEIMEVKPHGLLFADGSELEADEIVFATGYLNMRGTARKIFGDDIADQVNDVWGFDEEGELRTMWRRTGHPGFWFFGGNLALCRYFSRMLALQIKALDAGIMKYEDP